MARARNIKPGLFKNELLAERLPAVRLLFVGLWTLADREGRIEDRPKRIKLELFPYDNCDIDEMLSQLEEDGFIERYQVASKSVILICNFLKHQTPHGTEKDSELPDKDGSYTIHERNVNGYVTGNKRKNNVNLTLEECEPTVNAPDNNTLNPDSLNPEHKQYVGSKLPDCPHEKILALYAEHLPVLPQPRIWNDKRRKLLAARWKFILTNKNTKDVPFATDEESGLAFFKKYFAFVAGCDFLVGKSTAWSADLPWLLQAENFAKVIEGNYQNKVAA